MISAALLATATLSVLSPQNAAAQGSSDAVEVCRRPDMATLFERFGGTFGECVNLAKNGFAPPSRDQSDAVTAAYCGLDHSLVVQGVTNKGQCIKVVREFLATLP